MIEAYIGLGANIGDPIAQLQQALDALQERPEVQLSGISHVYQSPPMGPQDQPSFLNACARISTTLTPEALLTALKQIELHIGRVPTRRWGERCIDLDLLLYGDKQLESPTLTIPHPGVDQRAFVLTPLMDVLPADARMPDGRDIGKLQASCPAAGLSRADLTLHIPATVDNIVLDRIELATTQLESAELDSPELESPELESPVESRPRKSES